MQTGEDKMTNGNGTQGPSRIEFLKQKERAIRAALSAEMVKRARREQRETEKLQSLIGGAVLKACARSPEFRLMIAQKALCNVTDETVRRFLADRGWL
jgi:hypothetical protein